MRTRPFAIKEDYNAYMRAYLKRHYAENKNKYQEKQKRWKSKNPDYHRKYYQAHKNLKL